MKKLLFYFLSVLTIFSAGCGMNRDKNDAEKTAMQFYDALKAKDAEAAIGFCGYNAFDSNPKEEWIQSLNNAFILFGDIKSIDKKSGFNVSKNAELGKGSNSTVKLAYTVTWQYGKTNDSLTVYKEGDVGFKIIAYKRDVESAKYMDEIARAESVATDFYNKLKTNDYNAALALCDPVAFTTTPREQWVNLFMQTAASSGSIQSFSINKDKTDASVQGKLADKTGNFYTIDLSVDRLGGNQSHEVVMLYQTGYDNPIRIVSYQVNPEEEAEY